MVKVKVECDTSDKKLEKNGSFAVGVVVTGENEEEITTDNFIVGAISKDRLVPILVSLLTTIIKNSTKDPIDALGGLITAQDELVKDIKQYAKNNADSIAETFGSCLEKITGKE